MLSNINGVMSMITNAIVTL